MNMDPNDKTREIDQWLESGLRQYTNIEPRTGLESRVLAKLQAEHNQIASGHRWWWAIGTATALAAIVAAVWLGESSRESHPPGMAETSTTHREEAHALVQSGPPPQIAHPATDVARHELAHRPIHDPIQDLAANRAPKLDQFPSLRNMSKEESLLVRRLLVRPLLIERLNEPSGEEALPESTPSPEEVDLSIGSLEISPLETPDLDISESQTNQK